MAIGPTGFIPRALRPSVAPVGDRLTGSMVDVPGRGRTYLVDTGPPPERPDAPTVILLHALACTGLLTWYPAVAQLQRRYRVVMFDQRWHGRGIRTDVFRLDDCADDVAAVADLLGIDTFFLGGYSMGGLISQLTWRRHPHRVRGMVLAATAAWFGYVAVTRSSLELFSRQLGALRPRGVGHHEHDLDPMESDNLWAYRQFRQTSSREIGVVTSQLAVFDSRPWLHEVDIPTAVVVAAKDRVISPERQWELARLVPGSATYPFRAGHAGCVMRADLFVPAMHSAVTNVVTRAH